MADGWLTKTTLGFCFFLIALVLTNNLAESENILISTSHGEGSHYFVGKTIGHYLAAQGHNVSVLVSEAYASRAADPADAEVFNFIVFNHSVPAETVRERHQAFSRAALMPTGPIWLYKIVMSQRQGSVDDCEDLFSHNPEIIHRLEQGNFSVVLIDMIWSCSLLVAMHLDKPVVVSSPTGVVTILNALANSPVSLAASPECLTGFVPPMNFFQRVANVVQHRVMLSTLRFMNSLFDEFRERHGIRPDIPGSVTDLIGTYPDLYLPNYDFAMEYPVSLNPNIIPIGGITAKPPSPLPKDLEIFMQSSGSDGVVVFTLGSYLLTVREDIFEPFADAFSRIPQKVIWQLKGKPKFKLPDNVMTLPWLPQNDLLGHPNTRAFMFHGGVNGFYEAQYHAVPIVVIPFSGDAIDAASRIVHRGMGVAIDKFAITADTVHVALQEVLYNDSYALAAKRQSDLLRSKPMHPGERAAFWINHVIKHGGRYMKSPASELTFVQYYLLDVIAFISTIVFVILVLVFYTCRCSFRGCKRLCSCRKVKHD